MNGRNDRLSIAEELKPTFWVRRALRAVLLDHLPDLAGCGLASVKRHWGFEVEASLSLVREGDGRRRAVSMRRDWMGAVPAHVRPLSVPAQTVLEFSPLKGEGFSFCDLHGLHGAEVFAEDVRVFLENFFNCAAARLWTAAMSEGCSWEDVKGFDAIVRIRRFHVADLVVLRKNQVERRLWVNVGTDQVWMDDDTCEQIPPYEMRRFVRMCSFLVSFLSAATVLWLVAFLANDGVPGMTAKAASGLAVVGAVFAAGVGLRGWMVRVVGVLSVAYAAGMLIPWIGDAWDLYSALSLVSPVAPLELRNAPAGATYLAGSVVLTLLAILTAPSLALRIRGGRMLLVVCGILLGASVSPWPRPIVAMNHPADDLMLFCVWLMLLLSLTFVGGSGWALVGRGSLGGTGDAPKAMSVLCSKATLPLPVFLGLFVIPYVWYQIAVVFH